MTPTDNTSILPRPSPDFLQFTSPVGIAEAIQNAVTTASGTLRNLDWFEMMSVRGVIGNGGVSEYQVTVKLGFRYE
jgi:flavin-binding protein dodecin